MRRVWRKTFGDSVTAFGLISVLFLISLAMVPLKNYLSQWRYYQRRYLNLIRSRADGPNLERHMDHGIQQVWLPQQGVVDRCTSCHLGLKQVSLRGVQQPFGAHPPMHHSLTEFGCTPCHRGQGPATNAEEAHGSSAAWKESLLPAKYIESSCGQCHLTALPGTPQLNLGRKLLSYKGCVECHSLKLPDGSPIVPHDRPPTLKHIAEKTTREWMFAWIKDPSAYSAISIMPNFHLKDDEIRDITAFLIAQSTPHLQSVVASAAVRADKKPNTNNGAALYDESGCASCHAIQKGADLVGGDYGPELTRFGSKVKPQWANIWLHDPRDYHPGTEMPHFRFTAPQIASLSSFLLSQKDQGFLANVPQLPDATSNQIAHGKRLVLEYGCASCHDINGIHKPENFAPELTRVGSKPFAAIAFPSRVHQTLPDYIDAKIRNPRAFEPTLKMPQYKLTNREVDAITTALLAQTDRASTQPPSMRNGKPRVPSYQPAGAAGKLIEDLQCFSCHRINGRGAPVAPDLSWEGSAVQRKWLINYLKKPRVLRPTSVRRMPKFNLTDAEVTTLTDYILTAYQTPSFDRDERRVRSTPGLVNAGRLLFYEKYHCESCHMVEAKQQIDAHQDKSHSGPGLALVGARLNPAWIFHWLKDPQALRPGTAEPNRHMSDEDANELTAFLSSLKSSPKK